MRKNAFLMVPAVAADPSLYRVSDYDLYRAVDRGLCREAGEEPLPPKVGGAFEAAGARRMCLRCPVRAECLELALRHDTYGEAGVAGGTSRNQRRPMRRARVEALAMELVDEMIGALS